MKRKQQLSVVLAGTLLAGCARLPAPSPAPKIRQQVALSATINAARAAGTVAAGDFPAPDWWRSFNDAALDRQVAAALDGSPTLTAAAARVAAAQAAAERTGADDALQIGLNADAAEMHFPEHGLYPPPFGGADWNQADLGVTVSKDLDLWGRVQASAQAAGLRAQAAAADREAARLTLAAAVVQDWIGLAETDRLLTLADADIARRAQLVVIDRQRLAAGLEPALAFRQDEEALRTAQVARASLVRAQADARYALAALEGRGPDAAAHLPLPAALPQPATAGVPVRLPLDLISRRADVSARLLLARAAGAAVTASRAAFYPDINLSGLIGLQALPARYLFAGGSLIDQFGPAVHLPLFDGGRLRAALKVSEAQRDAAVAAYDQSVIDAAREVAQALDGVAQSRAAIAAQQQLLSAARARDTLVRQRLAAGLADRQEALASQGDVINQEAALVREQAGAVRARLALVHALGGGFDVAQLNPGHQESTPGAEDGQ